MNERVKCFVAYPSKPPSISEVMENAIISISTKKNLEVISWKNTANGGRFIINAILETIDQCQIFLCDLTNLNHNVLFELGYAIAKKKRILIYLDTTIEKSNNYYNRFKLLTTVGYCSYSNSMDIKNSFFKERPYETLENTIYTDAIENVIGIEDTNSSLFYLKSKFSTEASMKLNLLIDNQEIEKIIDDPEEFSTQSLSWYAQKVYQSIAVIVHFLSDEQVGHLEQNAKNSLVSGLAKGFNKPILMLAPSPYNSPIDYRDMLKIHDSASECEKVAKEWLEVIGKTFKEETFEKKEYEKIGLAVKELQNISLGEPFAENESQDLKEYFIETASYNEALKLKRAIFVGRKGVGKTAILFKLENYFRENKLHHICKIRPVDYELEGIIRMLKQSIPKSELGFLLESFWKFLIYTELTKSIYRRLTKNQYRSLNNDEQLLVKYVDNHEKIILNDFSIRLENAVKLLQGLNIYKDGNEQRLKISEYLHSDIIPHLRVLLGNIWSKEDKYDKRVSILIDNLDKAWHPKSELQYLSDFLLALISVSSRIVHDFEKSSNTNKPVNLSLTIFLRSDIFYKILLYAPERDKIEHSIITWDDPEMLFRVIEERFRSATGMTPNKIWERYFVKTVKGEPIKVFLGDNILPRPRDIISFCKQARDFAINRRHSKIEENDLLESLNRYSSQATETLEVEGSSIVPEFKSLIDEFFGSNEILSKDDIMVAMRKCDISCERYEEIVDLLCYLTFIGREIQKDHFKFQYNDCDERKFRIMAKKTADDYYSGIANYKIHKAYHRFLEINN